VKTALKLKINLNRNTLNFRFIQLNHQYDGYRYWIHDLNPGCEIRDPEKFITDPGGKKAPDPRAVSATLVFVMKKRRVDYLCPLSIDQERGRAGDRLRGERAGGQLQGAARGGRASR
jgi:hypothetical protein